MSNVAVARSAPPAGLVLAARVVLLACLVALIGLFAVMWLPVYYGNDGWLFLYPVFLVAWVPVETGAITATALAIVAAMRLRRRTPGVRTWPTIVLGIAFVCLSLPALWFGNVPQVLLSGTG